MRVLGSPVVGEWLPCLALVVSFCSPLPHFRLLITPVFYSPLIILIPGHLAHYVTAHHSNSHPHQSSQVSFDLWYSTFVIFRLYLINLSRSCYPHLEARHFLTSLKHVT
ncbi:hypothetical protein EDB87DRAFT_1629300 [Lactarius vividus]|nr:hypothetical protein EDB87DRAFT_1629300 [Lactarius vividus]